MIALLALELLLLVVPFGFGCCDEFRRLSVLLLARTEGKSLAFLELVVTFVDKFVFCEAELREDLATLLAPFRFEV